MITDSMSKYEVMKTLRKEFDEEILPYYYKKILPRLKALLEQRCKRENKTITLGWESIESKGLNKFRILKRGNKEGHLPLFVAEFRWNNKKCYGTFFQNGAVLIFQAHSLQRYGERVLHQDLQEISLEEVFYKHILNKPNAYSIVLPSPTHPYSYYYGIANALFFGDFDVDNIDCNFIWCNTCISYNETHNSQMKITQSLHLLQDFINKVKYDFGDSKNEYNLRIYLKKIKMQEDKINELKNFLITKYLLWQLQCSFKFEFYNHFKNEVDVQVGYLERILKEFNISAKSLSPYCKTYGVARKGEIEYKS